MACYNNCNNTNYTSKNNTWSMSSDLQYGNWTPYGSPCKNTRENYYGCGTNCNNSYNNVSGSSWTKWGNVQPRWMYFENYKNDPSNYLNMDETWNKQKRYSENFKDTGPSNYASGPSNYFHMNKTWKPQKKYNI